MTDHGFPGPNAAPPTMSTAPTLRPDPTAVMGRRILAWVIDLALYLVVAIGAFSLLAEYVEIPAGFAGDACEQLQQTDDSATSGCVEVNDRAYVTSDGDNGVQTLVSLGYLAFFVVLQGLAGGSPGKLLVGLRVVDEQGQRAGVGRSLVRTLLWVVDGAPWFAPIVGFITGLTSAGHRRVGDMAAKTYVVSRRDVGEPPRPPSFEPGFVGDPAGWTPPSMMPTAPTTHPTGPPAASAEVDELVPDISGVPDDQPAPPPVAGTEAPESWHSVSEPEATAEPEPITWEDPSPTPEETVDWAPPTTPGDEFDTTSDPSPTAGPAPFVAPGSDPAVEAPTGDPGPAALPPPQWDAARNTYLQWDPNQQQWLQWDATANRWKLIDS